MKAVIDFLNETRAHHVATIGLDGKPKVRPFRFMLEDGGKLYFCTSNQKSVYKEIQQKIAEGTPKEIQQNPYVEFCAFRKDFSWLRLSGRVVLSKDLDLKARVQEVSARVKSIYQTPDNPIFEIFYLEDAFATISDFSGNPPAVYNL